MKAGLAANLKWCLPKSTGRGMQSCSFLLLAGVLDEVGQALELARGDPGRGVGQVHGNGLLQRTFKEGSHHAAQGRTCGTVAGPGWLEDELSAFLSVPQVALLLE